MHNVTLKSWMSFLLVFALGCATSEPLATDAHAQNAKTAQPSSECPVPEWWNPPEKEGWIVAVSSRTSGDMQTAYDKAILDARAKIAQAVEVEIVAIEESIVNELQVQDKSWFRSKFERIVTSATRQSLAGSRPVAKSDPCREDDKWRAYVLVAYPEGNVWKSFLEGVDQDGELKERIQKTETYEEVQVKYRRYDWEDEYTIDSGK